jgi:hypothetical protein
MTVLLSVAFQTNGVRRDLEALAAGMRDRVIANAVNDTITQVEAAITRDIRATYNLERSYIKSRLRIRRASRTAVNIEASVSSPGRPNANLIRFVERVVSLATARKRGKAGTQRALYVKVRRGGVSKLVKGAFIGNQGRTVFRRVGKSRLPIEALTTLDVPQMFKSEQGTNVMKLEANQKFINNLRRQIQRMSRTQYVKVNA